MTTNANPNKSTSPIGHLNAFNEKDNKGALGSMFAIISQNKIVNLVDHNKAIKERKNKEASGLVRNITCDSNIRQRELKAAKGPMKIDIGKVNLVVG